MRESKEREALEAAREALVRLLRRDQRNTCVHDETHRGGAIWEICDQCGAEWADDRGGKPEWSDPPEWDLASDALALVTEALEGSGEDEPVLHGFGPGGICCQRAVEDRCAEHRDAG